MNWRLLIHGRTIISGNRATVLGAAEERGLIAVDTLGRETGEPVRLARVATSGVQIQPVATAAALRRTA